MRQQHQYGEAVRKLEQMAALTDAKLAKFADCAQQELPKVKAEPEQIRQSVDPLYDTAKQCMHAYDYEQAALILQQIPAPCKNNLNRGRRLGHLHTADQFFVGRVFQHARRWSPICVDGWVGEVHQRIDRNKTEPEIARNGCISTLGC
ncbi:MAG: hypothetical protein O3A00_22740 [Planctomycetota bacterium]|nr:hypothetical protein [Planctomycetota bacterium]